MYVEKYGQKADCITWDSLYVDGMRCFYSTTRMRMWSGMDRLRTFTYIYRWQ